MSENSIQKKFEKIYELYHPMVYGISCQVSEDDKQANEIFIKTFEKIHEQLRNNLKFVSPPIVIMKLAIRAAHEVIIPSNREVSLKLKQFENSPLLENLICTETALDTYCTENKISEEIVAKKIRAELMTLRYLKAKKNSSLFKFFVF